MWPSSIRPGSSGVAGVNRSVAGTAWAGEPSPQLIVAVSLSGARVSVNVVSWSVKTDPAPTVWLGPAETVTDGWPTVTWNAPEPDWPSWSVTVTVTV